MNKVESNSKGAVKAKSGAAENLRSLFEDQIKDIYWAEKALTKAIPDLIENATAEDLKGALSGHLSETQKQVLRLEQVFEKLGLKVEAKKCEAMAGILKEAESIIEETEIGHVRDAGIIAAAQKVEHYEIASYGTLLAFAKTLGASEVEDLLLATLNEEKNANAKLSEIAEATVTEEASEENHSVKKHK